MVKLRSRRKANEIELNKSSNYFPSRSERCMPHTICHIEIPTVDSKKSSEFYKNLFGWKIDFSWGPDYVFFGTGEGTIAGGALDRKDEIKPGNIIVYVQVEDINTMLEKAVTLGGKKVKEKTEIPTVGWFGLFTDLDGNMIGLFTPKQ